MSNISFADDAWSEYLYWQTQDKKTLKKINALLKEIQRNPFDGAGKPEPLKNDKSGLWSPRKRRAVISTNRFVKRIRSRFLYRSSKP